MTVTEETCCAPGAFDRRTLLKGLGAAGLLTFGSGLVTGQAAFAAGSATDTLVVIFLRGAADWLSIVPPVGDPNYAVARPTIAVPQNRALQLDSTFGLHPALQPLMPWWTSGQLGFVHAAGSADPTRSHFDAQASIESGVYGTPNVFTGWLDRYLASGPASTFEAVARGGSLPASLAGNAPALAMSSLSSFSLPSSLGTGYPTALAGLHAGMTHPVASQAGQTVTALGQAASVNSGTYTPSNGAVYPTSGTGPALADLARLIKAGLGMKVATLDVGNWDMHQGLGYHGAVDGGWMQNNLVDLGGALAAFAKDLGSLLANVSVVTVTDFGRRVGENGSGGVDHGHGQAMMLLGGGTRGGRVWGQWPTLAPAALDQGDLAATTDLRQVFGELLADRMGASDAVVRSVFPGWSPSYLDCIAPR